MCRYNILFGYGNEGVSRLECGIVEGSEGCEPGSGGVRRAIVWKSVPETPGSVCSNTEPGASGIDFRIGAPQTPPDHG